MTKRIITIILVLLTIFLLIIGGIWLVGRHTATKQGSTPLTFRQFLGLSTTTAPGTGAGQGTLGSLFTAPGSKNNTSGTGSGGTSGTTQGTGTSTGSSGDGSTPVVSSNPSGSTPNNVQTSQFTNDTLSPSDTGTGNGSSVGTGGTLGGSGSIGGTGTVGSGGSIGTSGGFSSGGVSVGGGITSGTGTVGGGSGSVIGGQANCTAADTNISFTPDEIAQLNALQAQFNTLNTDLATNDQVAAELATYSSYKLEEAKIAEMQSFCQATAPLLTNPAMQRHVPTPFWHDLTQDTETYTGGAVNNMVDGNSPTAGESFLERILRINLW